MILETTVGSNDMQFYSNFPIAHNVRFTNPGNTLPPFSELPRILTIYPGNSDSSPKISVVKLENFYLSEWHIAQL